LVTAAKFLVAATINLFVFPNFVAATKPFFPVRILSLVEQIVFGGAFWGAT